MLFYDFCCHDSRLRPLSFLTWITVKSSNLSPQVHTHSPQWSQINHIIPMLNMLCFSGAFKIRYKLPNISKPFMICSLLASPALRSVLANLWTMFQLLSMACKSLNLLVVSLSSYTCYSLSLECSQCQLPFPNWNVFIQDPVITSWAKYDGPSTYSQSILYFLLLR